MPFFKELRRRSKANFRSSDSSTDSSATVPTQKSSSTLSSSLESSTPPSSHPTNSSSTTLPISRPNAESTMPPLPTRPPIPASNRNSMIALSPTGSNLQIPGPTSAYAPRKLSVQNGTVVHQKIILINGEIGENPQAKPLDGDLTVHHDRDDQTFPPTHWPVSSSYFKALIYLSPGWNRIRLDFTSPKLSSGGNGSSHSSHSAYLSVNYVPADNTPPLQLAIIVASDSTNTFDATPGRIKAEGNDLSIAIRKFRMAAHLCQAFTAEQMYRHKLGRKSFRFEEEWQVGTLSMRDWESGTMKNEARVHVIRCDKTMAELRDTTLSQHDQPGKRGQALFDIVSGAVTKHFSIQGPAQKRHVAALLLDTQWNKEAGLISGHAAMSSNLPTLSLAVFGSHALQSYPSCIEEVVPAFTDCTKTDLDFVANDAGESGSSWEAASTAIGAQLQGIGHLFGSPHQEHGVMAKDYVRFNRTFCVREPYTTRIKSPGLKVVKVEDECGWHRLDALRFRYHPCFRTPSDELLPVDESFHLFPVGNGRLLLLAASGISHVEVYTDDTTEVCKHWFEYLGPELRTSSLPKQVILAETDIRAKLPEDQKKAKLRVEVFTGSSRKIPVKDVAESLSKTFIVNLPAVRQAPRKDEGVAMNALSNVMGLGKSLESRQGFKGSMLGLSGTEGSQPQEVILESTNFQSKLLTSVKIHYESALYGVEFCYEDGASQLFGKHGENGNSHEFFLDTRRGETILGFNVRVGSWIEGIEVLTSSGRRSGMFGDSQGGSGHTLIAPRGYSFAGLAGSCGAWVDGIQIIITR